MSASWDYYTGGGFWDLDYYPSDEDSFSYDSYDPLDDDYLLDDDYWSVEDYYEEEREEELGCIYYWLDQEEWYWLDREHYLLDQERYWLEQEEYWLDKIRQGSSRQSKKNFCQTKRTICQTKKNKHHQKNKTIERQTCVDMP